MITKWQWLTALGMLIVLILSIKYGLRFGNWLAEQEYPF